MLSNSYQIKLLNLNFFYKTSATKLKISKQYLNKMFAKKHVHKFKLFVLFPVFFISKFNGEKICFFNFVSIS